MFFNLLLMLSILCAGLVKPQGIVIIVPFFIFGLVKHGFRIFKKPEYYSIIFALIPFVASYLANPSRLAAFQDYFVWHSHTGDNISIVSKIFMSISKMVSADNIFFILAIIGMVIFVIIYYKRAVSHRKNSSYTKNSLENVHIDMGTLFSLSFIYMLLILIFVMFTNYYYLVYLNIFEVFFISYVLYYLSGTEYRELKDRKARELNYREAKGNDRKAKGYENSRHNKFRDIYLNSRNVIITRNVILIILLLAMIGFSFVTASPYSGMQNMMYKDFADKHQEFWQKHASEINMFLSDQSVAIVGGYFGYQYEYYIDKPVFRTCFLENSPIKVTKAIVMNVQDIACKNQTEMIQKEWTVVKIIKDKGSLDNVDEEVTLYQKP